MYCSVDGPNVYAASRIQSDPPKHYASLLVVGAQATVTHFIQKGASQHTPDQKKPLETLTKWPTSGFLWGFSPVLSHARVLKRNPETSLVVQWLEFHPSLKDEGGLNFMDVGFNWASLVVQMVTSLPEIQETWVWSPGEGNGYPLQYSCLENSMDRDAWPTTVHGVTKSRARLND